MFEQPQTAPVNPLEIDPDDMTPDEACEYHSLDKDKLLAALSQEIDEQRLAPFFDYKFSQMRALADY